MPRRNNRDKRYDPKEYDNNNGSYFDTDSSVKKPSRKRKSKSDKKAYNRDENDY
jgi:hypothetical protein